MSTLANRSKVITALNFVVAAAAAFSQELHGLIRPANGGEIGINLRRHTAYVRKNATNASSRWSLIDENTKKIDGVSSISDVKLPKNEAVVFDKIALGYATNAAEGKEGALDYTATKAPAALRNADLVIMQNGREVLNVPVADIVKGQSPTNSEDYYHDLESLCYLVDDQPMEWTLRFPSGQGLTQESTEQHYVELRLQGFKTVRKNK